MQPHLDRTLKQLNLTRRDVMIGVGVAVVIVTLFYVAIFRPWL